MPIKLNDRPLSYPVNDMAGGAEAMPAEIAAPLLLTLAEAAKRLAVSLRTARRLVDRGEIAHVRVAHTVRISETDLADFIARNRRAARTTGNFERTGESKA